MNLSIDRWPVPAALTPPLYAMALAFALVGLALFTQANRFPSAYHPDEPSKARQVIEQEYNFHHPMLMLSTATLAARFSGAGDSVERVTIAGRWVSASFTAAAIFFLVLLTCAAFGALAGLVSGLFLVTNHQLFELAHYFKEDPAVLLGVSAFFLALLLYDRQPGPARAVLLGAATGLAVSGKYVGILVAPLAIGIIFVTTRRSGAGRQLAFWAAAAITVFAFANFPVFLNPGGFASGFERELGMAVTGHKGITRSVPHGVYGAVFRESTNAVLWILMGVYAVSVLVRWRRMRTAEWMFALYPLVFAIILSFSPKTHHRYFLPATGLLLCFAAAGAAAIPHFRWGSRPLFGSLPPAVIIGTVTALALAVQMPRFIDYYQGFSRDGRSLLAEYLRANVPPGTLIVQDKRVNLPALGLPYAVEGRFFAADAGTLDDLRARGVIYVAVAEGDYGRFFRENFRPKEDEKSDYVRRRDFYDQLFREGTLVLECPSGTLQYLQPHLKLYRIQ